MLYVLLAVRVLLGLCLFVLSGIASFYSVVKLLEPGPFSPYFWTGITLVLCGMIAGTVLPLWLGDKLVARFLKRIPEKNES